MSKVDATKPHLRRLFDGRMYEVSGEMIVGRLAECDIVLDHEGGISRKHARFAIVDTNLFITDLGSLNGTLLNGELVASESRLFSGDVLIFDKDEYEVLIPWQNYKSLSDSNKTVFISGEDVREEHEAGLIDVDTEGEHVDVVNANKVVIDAELVSDADAVSDAKVASDARVMPKCQSGK